MMIPPMEHLPNDDEDHRNQHENSHKVCNEMWHPVENLVESQWKLRQQHDQNFPIEAKPRQNKCYHQKTEISPKEQDYENLSLESE